MSSLFMAFRDYAQLGISKRMVRCSRGLNLPCKSLIFHEFYPNIGLCQPTLILKNTQYRNHPFVDPIMQISVTTHLLTDICTRLHLSLRTEQFYSYWLRRYIGFLSQPNIKFCPTSDKKIEAFLTSLARAGVATSARAWFTFMSM